MGERKFRKYLVIFQLPRLQREHAKLKEALEHHGGNIQLAIEFVGPKPDMAVVRGYFFISDKFPSEMGFPLLNGDKHMIVEVGGEYWVDGNTKAQAWLEKSRELLR